MISAVGNNSGIAMQLLNQVQQQSPQERFVNADIDSSNSLSLDEYSDFAPSFVEDIEGSFDSIDTDGDRALTEAELKTFAESNGVSEGRPPPPKQEAAESTSYKTISDQLTEFSSEQQQKINEFLTALLNLQENIS